MRTQVQNHWLRTIRLTAAEPFLLISNRRKTFIGDRRSDEQFPGNTLLANISWILHSTSQGRVVRTSSPPPFDTLPRRVCVFAPATSQTLKIV